ncbi:hypothetical protein [Deinococcus aluminii]|uniref:Uncharacterized protein n=1 Tax=Deinococcus aluminii TaxID=1656885 RepID=A0ABP9XEY2_9DEIO
MPVEASRRPEHRLYLQLSKQHVTVLHVRNAGRTGNYFQTSVQGRTEEEQRLSALLTGLSSIPFHTRVYVHTNVPALRDLLRQPIREWPRPVRELLDRKSLQLRPGQFNLLDDFWKDLLSQEEGHLLPRMDGLNNFHLHTYAVTDGLQTHASGLLYGEGELHLYDKRSPGELLSQAELDVAAWALDLVAPSKTIELRHQHPKTQRFWEETDAYLQDHPGVKGMANRIGKLVEQKQLRFNVPASRQDDALARAVRWYTGRSLA